MRSDREKALGQLSTVIDRNNKLEMHQAVLSTQLAQIKEDCQVSRSQVLSYKKQVDFYKRELEDERKRAQVLQERIDTLDGLQEELSRLKAEVNLVRVWLATIQWYRWYPFKIYLSTRISD